MQPTPLTITRVCNACTLIRIGDQAILTDPYFMHEPIFGITEPIAMKVADLPRLTAIIGCHDVGDHWQIKSLAEYPHDKSDVSVFVAMKSQMKSAADAGFTNVEVLGWGEKRMVAGTLEVESVRAQRMMRWTVNNYVLRCGDVSVMFGSEARDLEPLQEYRAAHGRVNVAVFPVNGVHMLGFYQLVMTGRQAVEGARLLGAGTMFAVHDAHRHLPFLMSVKSSGMDAESFVCGQSDVEVVRVAPGVPWSLYESP